MGNYKSKKKPHKNQGEEMPDSVRQRVRDAFNIYDTNGDGTIQRSELEKVLEHFLGKKPSSKQLDKIFSSVDLNKDGVIDFLEFEAMMATRNAQQVKYRKMFQQYDHNGDGFITKDELLKTLQAADKEEISEEDVEQIIEMADVDEDGKINYKEFIDFFV